MQAIATNVYIEDQYPGVTLGAIALHHGLLQIDAPPSSEDGRSWRAALLGLNTGVERLLINVDSHPDRTLGARAMDCTVVAHEKTAQAFRNRPNTFKAQGVETGADWESIPGLGSIRWVPPEISFTSRMVIDWSNVSIVLEHHPGPAAGAIWVILPDVKVVFVGDLLVKNQPPFLANANIPEWLEALTLLSKEYKDFTIVSGRGGVTPAASIQGQADQLKKIHEKLENLAEKKSAPDAVEGLVQSLIAVYNSPAENQKQHVQRLSYGLRHYYARHYHITSSSDLEDE